VFKNPENAGMVRKISFQAKSYLFNLHEMFKNSGSGSLISNRRNTASLKYNDDISLLISQHIISGLVELRVAGFGCACFATCFYFCFCFSK
jgi:hypothetical protein